MKNKVVIIIISLIMLLAIGFSYSYFTGGNVNDSTDLKIASKELSVIFTDTKEISNLDITPGWSDSKSFTVENKSNGIYNYNIVFGKLVNTFVTEGSLQYKITSSNGGYNMDEWVDIPKSSSPTDVVLVYDVDIEVGVKQEYTIEFRYYDNPDVDQSEDIGKEFNGSLMITEGSKDPNKKTLYTILTDGVKYSDVKTSTDRGSFDSPLGGTSIDSSYDTTGVIYKESERKEDGRDVYYFAGNPQDNWVKFAGFYWRIIRTNEDGSVRLLYAGTSPDTQTGYINNTIYTYSINNSTYDNTMYVGWKYGTSGSLANNRGYSNQGAAKAALDSWYSTNITGNNANMVSTDAIYCNDRAGDGWRDSGTMYYAASNRLYNSNTAGRQPSYKCGENTTGTYYTSSGSWSTKTKGMYSDASNADKFSKTTGSGGNGQLAYPVGLMTADEVAFVGGKYGSNAPNTYYYRNSRTGCTGASGDPCSVTGTTWWWTMSPYYFSGGHAIVFIAGGSGNPGYLGYNNVNFASAVRPVLSLKNEVVVISGNGTADNPFEVDMTTSGSSTKYNVTLNANNANIDGENVTTKTKEVVENGSVIFNVVANDTYELGSVSCDNGAIGFVENGKVVINDVKGDNVCNVEVTKKRYLVNVTSNNDSYGTVSPTSQSVEHGSSATITISPKPGYLYKSNTCGGTVSGSTMTISNVTAAKSCTVTFEMSPVGKTLYTVLTNEQFYTTVKTRASGTFDAAFGSSSATTKTIYRENTYRETSGNNNKNVYYFAGNVSDNWVEFAGYMWRIIRTNEDGGVRLLYHGTSTTATDAYIGTGISVYNGTYNNTMYVGYMYGSTGSIGTNRTNGTSSSIKTLVDNWYIDNINSSYNGYVSETAIYCNDRASGSYASSGEMYYAAISRLGKKWQSMSGNQPSYQCGQNASGGYFASRTSASSSSWINSTAAYTSAAPNVADKFSKSTASGGNGKLTYPVGLMTADEVAFAGGLLVTSSPNTYYYLNSAGESSTGSNWWWTMSPYAADSNRWALVFGVSASNPGRLDWSSVNNTNAVRPVLSLKSCVLVSSGNGTASSPYKVELPSTCSTAAN